MWGKDKRMINGNKRISYPSSKKSLMVPNTPIEAINYLSRGWSASSSDFLKKFQSSAILAPTDHGNTTDGTVHETQEDSSIFEEYVSTVNTENNWVCLSSNGISRGALKHQTSTPKKWKKLGNVKSWFTKNPISSGGNSRKEQHRLQRAEIHAALSITQLAAAVASFAAKCEVAHQPIDGCSTVEGKMWEKEMNTAVASAAALVATVCAEAAKSVGADRAQITSAINSTLAVSNADEMAALTAMAATCMRGVSTLKLRDAEIRKNMFEFEELLARGTQLTVRTPKGITQEKQVIAILSRRQLILKVGKDHFWSGMIMKYKKYTIIDAKQGEKVALRSIELSTSRGEVLCLLFEDEKLLGIWGYAISCILASLRNPN